MSFDPSRKRFWAIGAIALVFAIISIDDLAAGTSLITPINETLTFTVTAICAAIGLLLGAWIWLADPTGMTRGIRMTLGLFLLMPVLAGAWGNLTVWRIAEHLAFDFSDARWTTASYPILYVSKPSRKARLFSDHTASIDPFDVGKTKVPITEVQYDSFQDATGTLCITVEQREAASGAIQVRTRGTKAYGTEHVRTIAMC